MSNEPDRSQEPSSEQLAAYADGELQGADRQCVEVWLSTHPDAATEVEQQRLVLQRWQEASIPEPTPEVWDQVLERIKLATRGPGLAVGALPATPPWRRWLLGISAAAALLGVLTAAWLLRPTPAPTPGQPNLLAVEEPFPVAQSQDIVIISMDPNDKDALAVGEPLELPELSLASHDEITLVGSPNPRIRLDEWSTPMIVDPLVLAGRQEP